MARPRHLNPLVSSIPAHTTWPFPRTRAYTVPYLAWDEKTMREAVIVLPSGWSPRFQPQPLPLVISPHGRNNFAWSNAVHYWQELPAEGPFALICPDGLSRAHDRASDPLDQPPSDPSLFTYGYRRYIDDLARMPKIVQETLPWLPIDLERIYVLGSSMGGQETLLLAARYPGPLSAGTGRLVGAAAFDATCDLATQCAYLSQKAPASGTDQAGVAARMLEEVNARPSNVAAFRRSARFYNSRLKKQQTIGQLLDQLHPDQSLWDERSPLHHVRQLSHLPFPLKLYWSSRDSVVGNQDEQQTGRLYRAIKGANRDADVDAAIGRWAHSAEFVPGSLLSEALHHFELIT
jgi:pimeloyl-ACP methyl ester carboxylesterase